MVEAAMLGQRLDKLLGPRLPSLSRSYIQGLIERGAITVNGNPSKPGYALRAGDSVAVTLPPAPPQQATPEPIPLQIVYEDSEVLVIDKPPGLVVHPAPGHSSGTLVNALLAHSLEIAGAGDPVRPGIVHRLDKDTSGLLLVAKTPEAQASLAGQIQQHQVDKHYLALIYGQMARPEGSIDAPIGRDPKFRQRMALVAGGRESRTHFTVERIFPRYSLLRLQLETGRTHQIRVHLAAVGHPVVGDIVYGGTQRPTGLARQFLHATELAFTLPGSGQRLRLHSPLPPDLQSFLDQEC